MPRFSEHTDTSSTDPSEIESLRKRLRAGSLQQEDLQLLDTLLGLLLSLLSLLQQKNLSISRLKRLLFGPTSDARARTKNKPQTEPDASSEATTSSDLDSTQETSVAAQKKRRGHGRLSSAAYTSAAVVSCTDPELQPGAKCPDELCTGHLYDTRAPQVLIRLTGQPLIAATRFEQQALRCSSCQERFIAPLPQAVKPQKYDVTADVAMALTRYGAGLPFYRLARMQKVWGVPLPESVQFERCERVADAVLPVFLQMRAQAAQCQTLYADDTRVKILALMKENERLAEGERRGMQTTGMVAKVGGHQIVLYTSGRRHSGENVNELLRRRCSTLPPPIQMSDALANNWTGEFQRIVAKCLAHARRQFVEIEGVFPGECKVVLDALGRGLWSRSEDTRDDRRSTAAFSSSV